MPRGKANPPLKLELLDRMECGHLQADLVADPKCRYCDEGYSRIQSSVTEAFVHVGTPVGRVVCTGNPTFIFKESPTDAHHKAMPASYCRICAEQQKVREEATVAGAGAQKEADAKTRCWHCKNGILLSQPGGQFEKNWVHTFSDGGTRICYANESRNAPLVTSDEGAEWLERDRREWFTKGLTEARRQYNEAQKPAQSTGTPAGTP